MDYLAKWREILARNKLLYFLDIILKGYAQVLISLNPLTGLLLFIAIFYLSRTICLLTLLGVAVSTLTAFIIRARSLHINSGVYGFNGIILGIAWLWFLRMNITSVILLVFTAFLSSLIMKLLINRGVRTKINLPAFSIPSLTLIWLFIVLSRYFLFAEGIIGPDKHILQYWQAYKASLVSMSDYFISLDNKGLTSEALSMFFRTFHRQVIASFIIFLGIRVHSRISALVSLISFLLTVVMAYCLGGFFEFINLEFYLYNTIPCSLALGGTFLVHNRKVFVFTMLNVAVVIWLMFMGMRYFPIPVFIAPFNLVTIIFLGLAKSDFLKRKQGFYAVPMDFVSTPEFGLEWYRGELYADNYWQEIEKYGKG